MKVRESKMKDVPHLRNMQGTTCKMQMPHGVYIYSTQNMETLRRVGNK